ncbi:MAG: undecaprenyl-diphosphate phosphatase [Pirellulales bacterium]|nr:undecaprenyl-diphosphate phosphatase [Pirellulales bacterium]
MPELIEILLLAIIQGIGEFLPISSSGHVVVGLELFERFGREIPDRLTVNIVLHLGTLASILVFYRRRIVQLLGADRRVILLVLVGSIPAGAAGLLIKKTALGAPIEAALENALLAGAMFPLTGLGLLWAARRAGGQTPCRDLSYRGALAIGLFQALAILPGISRSGATIVAGLATGLRRDEAAAFSFLLAIPAIAGAGLLETVDVLRGGTLDTPPLTLLVGALVSFAVGLAALAWLIRWLQTGRLHLFAWYLIPLGALVVLWQLWG